MQKLKIRDFGFSIVWSARVTRNPPDLVHRRSASDEKLYHIVMATLRDMRLFTNVWSQRQPVNTVSQSGNRNANSRTYLGGDV